MTPEDDRRRSLERFHRDDPVYRRRKRLLAVVAVVLVLAAAFLLWRGVGRLQFSGPGIEGAAGGLVDNALAWWLDRQADLLRPPSADDTTVVFVVAPGQALSAVASSLESEGLIRDAATFELLARVRGLDREVQAGEHALRRSMSAEEVLAALLVAAGPSVKVTVPEGWRYEQVAERFSEEGVVDEAEFSGLVASGMPVERGFPQVPDGASLEGYLFPDTYEFEPDAGAASVIEGMLDNFEARFSVAMREQTAASGMSVHEVVTLASIVEREAAVPEERSRIAAVFLNRLAEPPYLLDADPTVQFALGYDRVNGSWWTRWLTTDDLSVDSAYNTYVHPGLPPGPIASPGLAAIKAVLEPEEGDWMYFVADDVACDGSHVFAATWEEHLDNVARYQTGGCRFE